MKYINCDELRNNISVFNDYCGLLTEYGCEDKFIDDELLKLKQAIDNAILKVKNEVTALSDCENEPNTYEKIMASSEGGNNVLPVENLKEKIKGAIVARFAGCVLGAVVENWPIEKMKKKAAYEGVGYPPEKYWSNANDPYELQYYVPREGFTESKMTFCPSDDDITYTMMSLLIMEKYGKDFTVANVGEYWTEHLPVACTAEDIALKNLKKGINAEKAGEIDNPYSNWIGALIRADGFGYACAGNPHLAAKLGYVDAYLTHRRNGIYGEMLFAAAIAAAFSVKSGIEAIKIGLKEIPKKSMLYKDITWALNNLDNVKNYEDARRLVDERFCGQHCVHTNNNACLIVFGVHLGEGNVTKAITETVAMGLDNDCTAATVGSIIGATVGFNGIEEKWYKPFNNTVKTYIKGHEFFNLDDAVERFAKLN